MLPDELLPDKSIFDMQDLFKDLLIRVQDRHVPIRRKDKDGKIKKEVVLGLLKNIKVDKTTGPDCIYPRDNQHGFVQGRSCLINLIEFFEEVTKVINKGRAMDVVYMDFSKAFDKVLM
eukprot:g41604.t1